LAHLFLEEEDMIESRSLLQINLTLVIAFAPGVSLAQTAPTPIPTFAAVEERLKVGQTVEILDTIGQHVVGRVTALSSSSLVVASNYGSLAFTPADVLTIKRRDPAWDGLLKGALVGFVANIFHHSQTNEDLPPFRDCHDCALGPTLLISAYGAAVGFGVDLAFGPRTIYMSAQHKRSVQIMPLLGSNRRGLSATVHF
jgi:hypothetical protein